MILEIIAWVSIVGGIIQILVGLVSNDYGAGAIFLNGIITLVVGCAFLNFLTRVDAIELKVQKLEQIIMQAPANIEKHP
jgi:hypothetical protein